VRYEDLIGDMEGVIRTICAHAALPFEPSMLEYSSAVDVSEKPHHRRLLQPPTRGVRDWRSQMAPEDVRAFEAIAGDLLADLGYELRDPASNGSRGRARLSVAWYRARMGAWNAASRATQRSPLWRRRHPRLF
jgi:hypothetical protein